MKSTHRKMKDSEQYGHSNFIKSPTVSSVSQSDTMASFSDSFPAYAIIHGFLPTLSCALFVFPPLFSYPVEIASFLFWERSLL